MKQHTTPCNECPFRRVSAAGYLGGNDPKVYSYLANRDGHFPCHKKMHLLERNQPQCAGRAIMWANQCKASRDESVPSLPRSENVFANVGQFMQHHGVSLTTLELFTGDFDD